VTARLLRWPVYSFDRNGYRDLATFGDQWAAADFVSAKPDGEPNRYIGEPRYVEFDDEPKECARCSETLESDGSCAVGCLDGFTETHGDPMLRRVA
jgi:hypothetical protein